MQSLVVNLYTHVRHLAAMRTQWKRDTFAAAGMFMRRKRDVNAMQKQKILKMWSVSPAKLNGLRLLLGFYSYFDLEVKKFW